MTTGSDTFGEFDLIKTLFAPLSADAEGAFRLTDDAALYSPAPGMDLILTKDAMVEGVHYLKHHDPFDIARKLLRVNLSDIAAMGATAKGYLLSITLTETATEDWLTRFAEGLKSDQTAFGISLLGGDTVSSAGPMVISLTLLGETPKGKCLRRNGARVGDLICVSGTIGDAALGLLSDTRKITVSSDDKRYLEDRYFVPQPQVTLGPALLGLATACLDISDGLLADIGHICTQSAVGAILEKPSIPLSTAAKKLVQSTPDLWASIVSGGDDYELAFTISSQDKQYLAEIEQKTGSKITVIGRITNDENVRLLDQSGAEMTLAAKGWSHR